MKVSELYKNKISSKELEFNEWQWQMACQYDEVLKQVSQQKQKSFFQFFWKKPKNKLKGYYVYGKVGRGKTMLMDLFYEALPIEHKMRCHFNDFMQYVQDRLNYYRQNSKNSAIESVAEEIYKRVQILCFDEFSVTDIADAMILSRLFSLLFEKGILLVATSNVEPDNLYQDGLSRELFLPFIDLLKQNCYIVNSAINKDFRLEKTKENYYYFAPLTELTKAKFEEKWRACCIEEKSQILYVKNRELRVEKTCGTKVFFRFEQLCGEALGVNDYNELAKNFATFFLEEVPYFNDENLNWAKRFILLIDILYEHNIQIFILAVDEIDNLYVGKAQRPERFEFARTSSRLFEMQSAEYIEKWQQKYGV